MPIDPKNIEWDSPNPANVEWGDTGAKTNDAKVPTFGEKVGNMLGGVQQSLYDIPQSAIELGARGTDAVGLSNGAYPAIHKHFQDARQFEGDPNSGFFKGGEIAGNVATTLPLGGMNVARGIAAKSPALAQMAANSPRLAKLGGAVANGVAQGVAASGLTSAASDAPLGSQLGLGAAFGGGVPLAGAALRGAGGTLLPLLLGETTGAGAKAVKQAFTSGVEGGGAGEAFRTNLRDPSTWSGVVDDIKGALGKMRADRGAAYRSGMVDISKDATVLDFKPLDEAMASTNSVKSFKGKDLSPKTADVRSEINAVLDDWRASDPAEYHTPEGFDALKQKIGDIKENLPYGSPQRLVADNAYNAVRKTIAEQAPAYDKVMKDYTEASDQLSALTKEFSAGPKGNPNTALRKLQSVMRDNANTSWGNRVEGAQALQDAGATNLMPSLAGQALSSAIPRGLNKFADGAALVAGAAHNPLALLAAPLASPRLVGEGAHLAGRAVGGSGRALNSMVTAAGLNLANLPKPSLATLLGSTAPGLLLAPTR